MLTERTAPLVRRASHADEYDAAALLLESGGAVYPMFTGSRRSALRVLRASYRRPGTTASAEIVTVAELEGRVAGVIAAYPVVEGGPRARRYLRVALARTPPWRWPRALRIFGTLRPTPPPHALYVDAVATSANFRRRGIARALLASAGAEARELGCSHLALETEVENSAARSLYASVGFEQTGTLPPIEPQLGEGYVCLLKAL